MADLKQHNTLYSGHIGKTNQNELMIEIYCKSLINATGKVLHMIRPHLEYIDFVIESSNKNCISKINKLQERALRRIEYCYNPEERLDYIELQVMYNIESLDVRRRRTLLRIMYSQSIQSENVGIITHDINLRSKNKVKLKNEFSSLTKLHASPYYRGCVLWRNLPEEIQKSENINVFKNHIRRHIV